MRWSEFLIPTTKEAPKDAVVASHQLMIRAGLIRQLAAGIYSYLPLGYRSLRKIESIVREEMNRAGAIELHMPVLHPIELWQQTGRTAAMGDVLLRLRPVRDGDEADWRAHLVLGPTHEEPVTEIARAYLNSYKQLPVNLYQIQVKFRGEARPKSGVLRTREFLMKDAYSFHRDKASLDEGYQKMYDAYCRIFSRCGLPYVVCEAESGPIGGDASHEFMVLTDAGEDYVALSENGDYAANTERATCAPLAQDDSEMLPLEEVHTPNQRTIEEVCAFLGTKPEQMIKTLVYVEAAKSQDGEKAKSQKVEKSIDQQPRVFVVLVRGDHEVNEAKLGRVAGAGLELADDSTIQELTGAAVGFAGPHTLDRSGVPYTLIVDQAVAVMRNAATGANKTDYHVRNVNPGRDFPLEARVHAPGDEIPVENRCHSTPVENRCHSTLVGNRCHTTVADVRNVVDGDRSPTGSGSPIQIKKAIEVGHVFKLGAKYSEALDATFLDAGGKPQPLIMGCYGIGLNRIMAAAIESHHDESGIIWPLAIAPFAVLIVALDPREEEVMQTAGRIHDELAAAGVDVLLDDRDERAGFKFKDADLIGIPLRITVGRKSLAAGVVELKERAKAEVEKLAPAEIVSRTLDSIRGRTKATKTIPASTLIGNRKRAEFLIRASMGANALRSSIRWLFACTTHAERTNQSDLFNSYISLCGWLNEALDSLDKAMAEQIIDGQIVSKAQVTAEWTHITGPQVKQLNQNVLKQIRNIAAFHWGRDIANARLVSLKNTAAPVVIATSSEGWTPNDTLFTEGREAIFDFLKQKLAQSKGVNVSSIAVDDWRAHVTEVHDLGLKVLKTIGRLILAMSI